MVSAAMTSCDSVPPAEPAPAVCLHAGFEDSEIAALRPAIQQAVDAGAGREDILADAETSCVACEEPENQCDVPLCVDCFAALVDELLAAADEAQAQEP